MINTGGCASLIHRLDESISALNSRIMDASYCAIDQNATRVLLDCIDVLEGYARGFQDEVVSIVAEELYEFQEVTGCDTAMEFRSALKRSDQQAEPVACRKKGSDGVWHLFHQATGWKDCSGFEPLFTHPSPPATTRRAIVRAAALIGGTKAQRARNALQAMLDTELNNLQKL